MWPEGLADGPLVRFDEEARGDLRNRVGCLRRPDLGPGAGAALLGQGRGAAPGHDLREPTWSSGPGNSVDQSKQ
eukprot:8627358-Alexandrium_andersonii.AAC.1